MATQEDIEEHRSVFNQALVVFGERDEVHKGLWKEMDMPEEDHLIQHKAKRWAHTRNEEDAIDLINYVAFSIQNQRRRNAVDPG